MSEKKYTRKAFTLLSQMGIDDDEHVAYLETECKWLDQMSAWSDLVESAKSKHRSTNPNNLMTAYLFGISSIDPLRKRTFLYDSDGIEEKTFNIVFDDDTSVSLHWKSHVRMPDGSEISMDDLRPGFEIPKRIFMIYPGTDKFIEKASDEDIEIEHGVTLAPQKGRHFFFDSNEKPDIDIDFSPSCLGKIIPMCQKMFGKENVVGVCTYQRFGIKSSIKDVSRVFEVPYADVNFLTANLPNEVNRIKLEKDDGYENLWDKIASEFPEVLDYMVKYPKAAEVMERLQGRAKSIGTHASALIISSVPIAGRIPLIRQSGKEGDEDGVTMISSWVEGQNRTDLSTFGFVKFDRLGLQTLDDIKMCLNLLYDRGKLNREEGIFVKEGYDRNWSDESYLNDPKALAAASDGLTNGCFQFDSPGIRKLLQQIKIDHFREMVAANAMYRPGVLKAVVDGEEGGHTAYCKRKHGETRYTIPEPLKEILSDTYGLLIFQEQVMKCLNIIGRIPLPDCEAMRKAISKKKMSVIDRIKGPFCKNAYHTVGMTHEEAEKFFDDNIVVWSGYGFNLSHSLAYGVVAMRTLYLKVHYPIEFFCAFMSSIKRDKKGYEKLRVFAADAARFDIEILGVDINGSRELFSIANHPNDPGREVIRFGLGHVKGIGRSAEAIIKGQPYKSFEDFLTRGVTKKTVVYALVHAGAFDSLEANRHKLIKYYESWRNCVKKGVKRSDYISFLEQIGFSKPKRNHPELYEEFIRVLAHEPWEEDESEEVDMADDRPIITAEEYLEMRGEELPDDAYGDDAVDNEISLSQETPTVEKKKSGPRKVSNESFKIDMRRGSHVSKSDSSKKSKGRTAIPVREFAEFVIERWGSVPTIEKDTLMSAYRDIKNSVPTAKWEDVDDFTSKEKLSNAASVYGCMMPFAHPINYSRWKTKYIRNYGETINSYVDELGNAQIEVQDCIDGYVVDIFKRTPRIKEGEENKKPRDYYRILIDDGYDRVMVTCWGRTWTADGIDDRRVRDKETGEYIIKDSDPHTGEIIYEMDKTLRPCDVIKKETCVRLKVNKDERFGFNLRHEFNAAQSIPMKRSWSRQIINAHDYVIGVLRDNAGEGTSNGSKRKGKREAGLEGDSSRVKRKSRDITSSL